MNAGLNDERMPFCPFPRMIQMTLHEPNKNASNKVNGFEKGPVMFGRSFFGLMRSYQLRIHITKFHAVAIKRKVHIKRRDNHQLSLSLPL